MYKLVLLLKRVAVPVLFILIEVLAINYYSRSTSYSRAKLLVVSNKVTGGMNSSLRRVGEYFGLRRRNELLAERVAELENQLARFEADSTVHRISAEQMNPYTYMTANVIDNSIFRRRNFFTLDRGLRDGVESNMAVLTTDGYVAGYVIDCTDKFSICMSLANTDFTMGGRTKNGNYIGSVVWNGRNYRLVNLTDIPHYANLMEGDTIISAVSYRFPPDKIIGTVWRFKVSEDKMNCEVTVKLAADLSKLRKVLLVKYDDSAELEQLQTRYGEPQK